ncbi:hypothetical protein ACJJTC_011365 [Scirpophaga incertulas]
MKEIVINKPEPIQESKIPRHHLNKTLTPHKSSTRNSVSCHRRQLHRLHQGRLANVGHVTPTSLPQSHAVLPTARCGRWVFTIGQARNPLCNEFSVETVAGPVSTAPNHKPMEK